MEYKESWVLSMDEEMVVIINNDTWNLVLLCDEQKPIGCKWTLKTKIDLDGNDENHKSLLVEKGHS